MDTKTRDNTEKKQGNWVQSTFIWPNGGRTTRIINLDNPVHCKQFAKRAASCYAKNGAVICVGVNPLEVEEGKDVHAELHGLGLIPGKEGRNGGCAS